MANQPIIGGRPPLTDGLPAPPSMTGHSGIYGMLGRGINQQMGVLSGDYLDLNRALQREAAERQMLYQTSSAERAMDFESQQAEIQRDWSSGQAQRAMDFESAQAQIGRDYQTEMSNTAYQRAVKDLQSAGLNPMLAVTQGGATAPSGMVASGSVGQGTSARGTAMQGSKAEVDTVNHALDLLTVIATSARNMHDSNIGLIGKLVPLLLG